MAQDDLKRKLAAILSADVKEYSRLMRENETATIKTVTEYRQVMASLIDQHHGRVVDSVGDNLLAEFASVVDAVQGAVAIQKEVNARNAQLPEDRKMLFRIGINLGDLVVEGDRIYGDGVNIASRIEPIAAPGGICLSRSARDQVRDRVREQAGERAKGAVAASDAFFPFADGIEQAAEAGVSAVIQPGGSIRDEEVIAAADEHGMAMVFTGMRHFRH